MSSTEKLHLEEVSESESNEFLTSFYDLVNENYAVIEFETDGTVKKANANFCGALGYTEAELLGNHHSMFVDESYVGTLEYKNFWKQIANGVAFNNEFKRITKDGSEIWIKALYSPVKDSSGKVTGAIKIAQDITDMKKLTYFKQMVDLSPVNTMFADTEGNLQYMNENSVTTLKGLEQYLPDKVENLVGQKIDIFHKNPAHQLKIIGNVANLPHKAMIAVGPETLDLLVSPVLDSDGVYLGPMVTWEVVTEKIALEAAQARSQQMVDKSPINTMMCNPEGELLYMNERSKDTLRTLEQYLPDKVDNLVGQSIDMFHKNPEHQRKIFGNPANLPHRAIIQLGPEKLDLTVSALSAPDNSYLGAVVNWEVVTDKVHLVNDLKESATELSKSAEGLLEVSNSLSAGAEETSAQSNTASAASEEVNAGVQTVATNMEEMTAAIKEITKTTNEASNVSNEAMTMAQNTNDTINKLGESSIDIGNVIKVISSIAQQTNLLALNATIEAARAGEAGKGFAVVANEVKELAKQTAQATQDITKKIENIQTDSKDAVDAISEISKAIEQINSFAGNIAASVEEQAATTNEVSRIVTESAEGVKQINENINQVSAAASTTGKDAQTAQEAAKKLGELAEKLNSHVAKIEV